MSDVMSMHARPRGHGWRSRWAAVGAAVAVTLGAGGVIRLVGAAGEGAAFVPVTPARVLDTRDPIDIGLAGPFVSATSLDLQITGPVATTTGVRTVVPPGATGVVLNVTVVGPSADGFLSVRPADAPGAPTTSSLNFGARAVTPNAVTVGLPTTGPDAGRIEITYDAYGRPGPATDVLVDVVGYFAPATAASLGPRAASATSPSPRTLPTTMTTVVEVALDAPAPGTVVVDANATVQAAGAGVLVICSVTAGTTVDSDYELGWTSPSTNASGTLSGTRAFSVAAGPFTARLVCYRFLSATNTTVSDAAITAIWTPTA